MNDASTNQYDCPEIRNSRPRGHGFHEFATRQMSLPEMSLGQWTTG